MRRTRPADAGFENKEMGPRTKEFGWPLTSGKGEETISSRASRKEHSLADILILTQLSMHWISNLRNCKTINLHCFKPLSLR